MALLLIQSLQAKHEFRLRDALMGDRARTLCDCTPPLALTTTLRSISAQHVMNTS